jgi:S-adenosylmethionine:tRNA ribosyltransferase-isomerase
MAAELFFLWRLGTNKMQTSDLDYDLPQELIAQTPIEPRDAARLLVVNRSAGVLTHRIFRDIAEYLRPGDLLVANESRVIPARLRARKAGTGGAVELLLLRRLDERAWQALAGGKRVRAGTRLEVLDGFGRSVLRAEVTGEGEGPLRVVQFDEPVESHFNAIGVMPLPPYIRVPLANPERYQTIYSHTPGSAAAPTAGLHFTPDLMVALRRQGVEFAFVTLHVGLDTFKPMDEKQIEEHRIHTEWCSLSPQVARQINEARLAGKRIIAVGTTSMRVLESAARPPQSFDPCAPACAWQTVSASEGFTDLFIYPGFQFRVVDAMLTNFHLPRSTLLALVSAFAGRDLIFHAYQEAIRERYRFYSFGDAMFLL